jgi:hypothetical protein
MKLSANESRLRHPLERPLFWIFVTLNCACAVIAILVIFKSSNWLATHAFLAKYEIRIRALATAAILGLPAIVFLRNTRHANIRGNSIRISPTQVPALHSILRSQCERLGMDRLPELYFSDEGIKEPARAYTSWKEEYIVLSTRFFQPNLEPMREVFAFLLGRELGRLRLGHANTLDELLLSYVKKIPYVRNPLLLVFTYSEDRYGAYLAPEGVHGLVALAAGRRMLPAMDISDYLQEVGRYVGIWSHLAQFGKDTPQIAYRIKALYRAGLWKFPGTTGPNRGIDLDRSTSHIQAPGADR